jgi:hypothetical protein
MTVGVSRAGLKITHQPALAPSPQPQPAPTARPLIVQNAKQRGPFWMPIWGPIPTLIDSQNGPISYGRRLFDAYMPCRQAVLRVGFWELLQTNPGIPPYFCKFNSGGPRTVAGCKARAVPTLSSWRTDGRMVLRASPKCRSLVLYLCLTQQNCGTELAGGGDFRRLQQHAFRTHPLFRTFGIWG